MMRKNKYILLFLVVILSLSAFGQSKVYDRLILMDGSVVEGRITIQHPGENLVFIQEDNEITYQLSDILAIERIKRSADELSGIDDVIETRAGKVYKGQITKQLLGKSVYLFQDNEVIQIINNADIACQKKEKFNQEQDIFEQTPFLDVVTTADKTYKGLIILQDYGSEQESSYLCVLDEEGTENKVEISDITEMQRIDNVRYAPIREFQIGEDQVGFNRTLTDCTSYTTDKNSNFIILREKMQTPPVVLGGRLVLETLDTPENRQGILVRATSQKSGKKEALLFSYMDMVTSPVQPEETLTFKKILRRDYQVVPGFYVFFLPQNKKVYVCEVQ